MKQARRAGAALALVGSIVLAGCSGGPGSIPGSGSTVGPGTTAGPAPTDEPDAATQAPGVGTVGDVCALLTAEEIREVTGLELEAPGAAGPAFGILPKSCGWGLASETGIPPMIALGVLSGAGRAEFDQYVAPFIERYGGKTVEGLGDAAADVGQGSVVVLDGDTIFQLQYLAFEDDDIEVATELAKKVLARLG
jgi:hypothetical protein